MKTYEVELTGRTPMMQHKMTEDEMLKLMPGRPKTKKTKATTDERTPRDIAQDHIYENTDKTYYVPMSHIRGAFAHVASDYKQTKGKRTYKAIAGGVFLPEGDKATILDPNTNKPQKKWEVDLAKANNRNAGKGCAVVVIRPRFDTWKLKFNLSIDDSLLPEETALEILEDAGRRAGIGSYRVSNGGSYGQFQVTNWKKI